MPIVDLASNPVVHPATFDGLSLFEPAVAARVDGIVAHIVGPNDLARLKLAAHREQDLVDLALLAGSVNLSARALALAAEHDDTERMLAAGAMIARGELQSGGLATVAEELLGRRLTADEMVAMERWLTELEREGL